MNQAVRVNPTLSSGGDHPRYRARFRAHHRGGHPRVEPLPSLQTWGISFRLGVRPVPGLLPREDHRQTQLRRIGRENQGDDPSDPGPTSRGVGDREPHCAPPLPRLHASPT